MEKHKYTIISFLVVIYILSGINVSWGQAFYVRAGATGASDGSDWINAYSSLPPTLVRGATYYIADGNYPDYIFDDPESGTQYITIKKATEADHGTDIGWQASYGDGQAILGQLIFENGYYIIDGQTGGGPGSWESGFGFKIQTTAPDMILVYPNPVTNLTFKHIDVAGDLSTTSYLSCSDPKYQTTHNLNGFNSTHAGKVKNITFSYVYIHDVRAVHIFTRGSDGLIIEYSKIARNGNNERATCDGYPEHKEFWSGSDEDNAILRYNIFEDIGNTAFIFFGQANAVAENIQIYGNIFWHTPNSNYSVSVLIGTKYSSPSFIIAKNWKFYNNTIAGIQGLSAGIRHGYIQGYNPVFNNIWFNNHVHTISISGDDDYNWYYGNYRTDGCNPSCNLDTENNAPHDQIGTADPFIDWQNGDFRLTPQAASEMLPGLSLSSPYNIDAFGNIRGADGAWDRGAIEHVSIPMPPVLR